MCLRLDLKIFLVIIIFILTGQVEIYGVFMLFALIHELGHIVIGMCMNFEPEKLELNPYGVSVNFKVTPENYNKKIKNANMLELKKIGIAIAGPLCNLIIAFVVQFFNIDFDLKMQLIYTNVLICLFNLLPIYPLDGGRILKGFLHICMGKIKAERVTQNVALVANIFLTAVSSIAIMYFKNIAIFFIVLFLWGLFFREEKAYRQKNRLYKLLEKY
jgi:stage IV sporulation protein FB